MNVVITKASGEKEVFSKDKLFKSLVKSGASKALAVSIASQIEATLNEGATTKQIYKKAHKILRGSARPVAGRYHLKRGIMELGPSGFPFEKYVSEILRHQGYRVQVGKIVQGKCVTHEVDVIAEKDTMHFMVECKYHNAPGMVCNVKIPLYIHARFKDVEAHWTTVPGHGEKFHQGWIVTNTRFTSDAITYGGCAGLNLVSLDFPKRGSLREMIETTGLYPLTCLTTLTQAEKRLLLKKKIVLCKELCANPHYLTALNVPAERIKAIIEEGTQLCNRLIEQHGQH